MGVPFIIALCGLVGIGATVFAVIILPSILESRRREKGIVVLNDELADVRKRLDYNRKHIKELELKRIEVAKKQDDKARADLLAEAREDDSVTRALKGVLSKLPSMTFPTPILSPDEASSYFFVTMNEQGRGCLDKVKHDEVISGKIRKQDLKAFYRESSSLDKPQYHPSMFRIR